IVRRDEREVAEAAQIHEAELPQLPARVLPDFERQRGPRLRPRQHLVGIAVLEKNAAAIGAPAGDPRAAAFAKPAVGLDDALVEIFLGLVARRARRGVAAGPERPEEAPLAVGGERGVDAALPVA